MLLPRNRQVKGSEKGRNKRSKEPSKGVADLSVGPGNKRLGQDVNEGHSVQSLSLVLHGL